MTEKLPTPQAISKEDVGRQSWFCVFPWQVCLFLEPWVVSSVQSTRLCQLKSWSGHFSWMARAQRLQIADGLLLLVWGIYYSWLLHGSYRLGVAHGLNYRCVDLINNGMFLHFQNETVMSHGGTSHSAMQITAGFCCCIKRHSVH